jgi:hypothetical protein
MILRQSRTCRFCHRPTRRIPPVHEACLERHCLRCEAKLTRARGVFCDDCQRDHEARMAATFAQFGRNETA